MDRISQTQSSIDELVTIMYSSLSYLTTKAAFKQVSSGRPIRQLNPQADDPETFEANRKELVTDLMRKARQLEYLISVLPSPSDLPSDTGDLATLEAELQEANREYMAVLEQAGAYSLRTVPTHAESLQRELKTTIRTLLDHGRDLKAR